MFPSFKIAWMEGGMPTLPKKEGTHQPYARLEWKRTLIIGHIDSNKNGWHFYKNLEALIVAISPQLPK